jgi:hypothetical protein
MLYKGLLFLVGVAFFIRLSVVYAELNYPKTDGVACPNIDII